MNAPPIRSWLFVPGDSEKKLAKIDGCGADAVILDLEDAVAPANKPAARRLVGDFLGAQRDAGWPQLWVRINPMDSGLADADLDAVVAGAPAGIVLPKADGPRDVARLSAMLDAHPEAAQIAILPVATETAIAPFNLAGYAGAGLTRLAGLTWGAEDLATAIGAKTNRGADGDWLFTFRMVRSLTLLAAHAARVVAIETLHADFRDEAGLRQSSLAARAEGFAGRLAIHPGQVGIINDCFTPSRADIDAALRVLDAFAADPGAGTVALDGRMLDIPHLRQAERTMAEARAFGCDVGSD